MDNPPTRFLGGILKLPPLIMSNVRNVGKGAPLDEFWSMAGPNLIGPGAADIRLRTVGADCDRRQEVAARALLTWSKCDQCGRIASGGRPQVAGLIEVNPSHTKAGWKP